MVSKQMKRYSTSLAITENQIKAWTTYHHTPISMATTKYDDNTKDTENWNYQMSLVGI